jgi:hypothetical protein
MKAKNIIIKLFEASGYLGSTVYNYARFFADGVIVNVIPYALGTNPLFKFQFSFTVG